MRQKIILVGIVIATAFLHVGCTQTSDVELELEEGSHSLSPAADAAYQCLLDQGWDVTIDWDGGIAADSSSIPEAQVSIYEQAVIDCYTPIDDAILAMSEAEIAEVYLDELKTRECLISEGYNVGAPPSEQTYVDTFQTAPWSAWADAQISQDGLSDQEWQQLNSKCTQPAWSLGVK